MEDFSPKKKQKLIKYLTESDKMPLELQNTSKLIDIEEDIDELEDSFSQLNQSNDELIGEVRGLKSVILPLVETRKGDPGEPGETYYLTEQDKIEIASFVEVPVVEKIVEKIVEKTEVIREVPIVTENNITKEVAVLDPDLLPSYGAQFRDGLELLQGEERLSKEAIKGLDEYLLEIEQKAHGRETNFGHVIRDIYAGDNITITYEGDTNRPTISANLPAGSGITRSIISTSGNATMAAASSTDYVYIVTGAHTMTLPTAVGNTNLYTVRNNHSAPITVNTTSSQNIIGSVTATSYSVYNGDARSFISNGTAWSIV